jgi:hypothetical protein
MTRSQKIICGVVLAAAAIVVASFWLTFFSDGAGSITIPRNRSSRDIMQPGADAAPKPVTKAKRGGKSQSSVLDRSVKDRVLKKD